MLNKLESNETVTKYIKSEFLSVFLTTPEVCLTFPVKEQT